MGVCFGDAEVEVWKRGGANRAGEGVLEEVWAPGTVVEAGHYLGGRAGEYGV